MTRAAPARRLAAWLLLLAVATLHGWLATAIEDRFLLRLDDSRPERLTVAFVRTLQPEAPPPVPPAPPAPAPAPAVASPAEAAASAPEPAPAPVATPAEIAAAVDPWPVVPDPTAPPAARAEAAPRAASAPEVAAAPAASPAAFPASAPAFEWPPSTRLSYALTGHYRGPVDGQAQVQWLRQGARYQVHLDVHIGPPFGALIRRESSSDGMLGAEGLRPRRYDERTRILLRDPRALTLWFDEDAVQLANGSRVPRPPGVQDQVSQFVQLTWRFTLDPTLLREGTVLEVPLALPRRVEVWTYDVRAPETLWTPAGAVEAVRVQPRREPRPGGDLVAEMWFAPALQYLPVRIVIRQDAETFVDLTIKQLPEQAAGQGPDVPSAASSPDSPRRP